MSFHGLTITAANECEILMTRVFDAPRQMVFRAFTEPALLQRWLGAFGGWNLEVCEVDLRVGGRLRYFWRKSPSGVTMGMSGVYLVVDPPARLVSTERFDDPWYPGEATSTVIFTEENGRTMIANTVRYETKEIRDAVLKSPMESGVAASYDALAAILTSD